MEKTHITRPSFLTFVLLFIGTGFVSGSAVHLGEGINTWDVSIAVVGLACFVLGTLLDDWRNGWQKLRSEGAIAYILLSICLSIGIGMASGGTQHFIDTPDYASILIPVGLFVGFMAFRLRENAAPVASQLMPGALSLLACGVLAIGLQAVIPWLPADGKGRADAAMQHGASHGANVTSEAAFLTQMVPHHAEAVTSAQHVLRGDTITTEQRSFLEAIIDVQTREIEQMQAWHRAWFNSALVPDASYAPMMSRTLALPPSEAWTSFLQEMIGHHQGAVQMAEAVLALSPRQELRAFAEDIIRVQSAEVTQMRDWLAPEGSATVEPADEQGQHGH
jgi:uncharacterized protein (DUF305 family)